VNELALFAGVGGGILGGKQLGWRTVCAVECDAYAASVLVERQSDSILEPFPVWDDVRTFDGKPWAGIVDVVSGGFPCLGNGQVPGVAALAWRVLGGGQ
jgi:DNA (cytosine-5)-methyltransferase 1